VDRGRVYSYEREKNAIIKRKPRWNRKKTKCVTIHVRSSDDDDDDDDDYDDYDDDDDDDARKKEKLLDLIGSLPS